MTHLENNTSGLAGVWQKLLAHSKVAEFTARRGLVVELFPFIVGASERMSARAISRFLEKEQGVTLSSVTVTRALNDPRRSWNLYFDAIEPSARTYAKADGMGMDYLFEKQFFPKPIKNPLVKAVVKAAQKALIPAGVSEAALILRQKWFAIDCEIRLKARPFLEHRLK